MKGKSLNPAVIAIGRTGSGKSTLLNKIIEKEEFFVGHNLESATNDYSFKTCTKFGSEIDLWDTIGFQDTRNMDVEEFKNFLEKMVIFYGSIEKILMILYVVPVGDSRFDLESFLKTIMMFEYKCHRNIFFVFTQSDFLAAEYKEKRIEDLKAEISQSLNSRFGIKFDQNHFIFDIFHLQNLIQQNLAKREYFEPQIFKELNILVSQKNGSLISFIDLICDKFTTTIGKFVMDYCDEFFDENKENQDLIFSEDLLKIKAKIENRHTFHFSSSLSRRVKDAFFLLIFPFRKYSNYWILTAFIVALHLLNKKGYSFYPLLSLFKNTTPPSPPL